MKSFLHSCFLLLVLLYSVAAQSGDVQFKADSAVSDVLFEYDGSETFASYSVSEVGFVEITFAKNVPNELYSEILQRLKEHKDINGVLAGTTGPTCSRF